MKLLSDERKRRKTFSLAMMFYYYTCNMHHVSGSIKSMTSRVCNSRKETKWPCRLQHSRYHLKH